MSNPYLDDPAQANPYIALAEEIEPTRPGPAVISAQQNEPDSWATAKRKGAALGLAPEIVSRNPAEVRKLELQQSLDQVRKTNPALADWLVRDDNLTLAQDDTESLGFIGRALEYPTEIASGFNRFVGAGISGLGDINDAVANRATAGLRAVGLGKVADALEAPILPAWANPSRIARGVGDTIVEQTVYETPEERRNMGHDVAQGLGSLVGQVVATYVNPAAAVTLTAGQGAEQQATRAEGEGATDGNKSNAVLIGATITAATEKMGLDILLERLPPAIKNKAAQWVADKILAAGAEGAQEGLEQVAHNAVAQLTYAPDSPLLEGVGDNATLGALVGGLARTVLTPGYRYHERRQQGQSENQQVDALSKMVQQSKLFARDPQKLADYIAGAKQTGASNVYLPAEDVTTLFQSVPEAAAAFEAAGVSRESILETTALNSDLAIPLETYLTKIAPDYHAQLGKAARLSPDGLTDADVDVNDEQNAAVERFLASVNDAPAEGQADMRVYNDVLGQLLGRYQQADAEQMASVVNAFFRDGLGARAGIDPMELYGRYGLRIVEQVERRVMGRVDPEVDSMIERLRAGDIPTEDQAYGPTLAEFLSGPGIRSAKNEPMSGEIRTLAENDRATRKGRQRLVREEDANALTLDYAREAAVEAGYLSPDATLDDLLDALNDGGRAEVNRDGKMSGLRDALTEMDREISRLGLDVSKASNEEIRRALFGRGATELDQVPVDVARGLRGETKMPNDPSILNQSNQSEPRRGFIQFGQDRQFTIGLVKPDGMGKGRNLSTFLHEFGHFALEVMGDVAADAEANPEIAADYAILLDWLGVKSRSEIGVEQHEKMARGFEKYLGEGTPPTPELAGAFARFRSWMKAIYKSLTSLNVELNPEVRGVMSRMLAGDAAIAQAEQATVAEPLFKEASRAGMTEPQFAAYLELQAKAHDEAETRIVSEAYNEVMRERKKWWREESNRIETDVRAEFEAMPVYRAWASLARNTEPNGTPLETPPVKLSKQWLVDRYGQKFLNENLLHKKIYSEKGGVDVDIAAEGYGFESGPSLVEALSNAQPLNQAIKAETASRMRELHGDMRNDGTLPERAMKAVHGNRRMKVIEAEIAALSKLAGEPAMTTAQARSWAQKQVAGKRIKDIVPYQYLRAERKAARESLRAANAGKTVEALAAARRRLANAVMFDEATKAREEVVKIGRYARRFQKKGLRKRLGQVGRLGQADAILSQYDFTKTRSDFDPDKEREGLRKEIEMGEIDAPMSAIAGIGSPSIPAVTETVDRLRDMRDLLKQVEALTRNEHQTMVHGEMRIIKDDAGSIADSVNRKGTRIDLSLASDGLADKAQQTAREALNAWLRPAEIARQLDSGDDNGPMTRLIIQPIRRAYSEVLQPMLRKAQEDVSGIYRKHYTLKELGKFGQRVRIASLHADYTKSELLVMALNWGNADNKKALLDSTVVGTKPMTEQGIEQAFREHLDARDWAFVQDVWGYMDSYWLQAKEVERRRKGVTPKKVVPVPFEIETSDGKRLAIGGGYFRLKYNSAKSSRAKSNEIDDQFNRVMVGGHISTATRSGSQNERVGSAGMPVLLDLGIIDSHLSETIRDIAMSEPVAHVYKVLNSASVQEAMTATGNKPANAALGRWLKDSAAGELAAQGFLENGAAWLRTGFSKSKLAWKATVTLLQLTGFAQTAVVVGKTNTAQAIGRYISSAPSWHKHVMEESTFMRTRDELQSWNKDVQDTKAFLNSITGPTPTTAKMWLNRISSTYFLPIAKTQMVVDDITWMAGYAKATKEKGLGHDAAVLYADGVVENAQTSGLFSDRSALERGSINSRVMQSQFIRIWTTLGSYMIAKGNIAYGRGREVARNPSVGGIANFGADMMLLFVVEGILGMLIRGNWPDDDEEVAPMILSETANNVIGTVPFVREVPGMKYGSGNTPIGAFAGDAYKVSKDITEQFTNEEKEFGLADFKHANNLLGTLFHYPSSQMNTMVSSYWADQVEGEDTSAYEYIVTGPKD